MRKLVKNIEKELVLDVMFFIVTIVVISLFWYDNIIVTALLVILAAVGMKVWYKKKDIYFFVTGMLVGPFGEIICIYFGAWRYANPTLLGIPIWLPIIWGFAIVVMKRLADLIARMKNI